MSEKGTKRICLFAGYDAKGEVADYVVYHIEQLAKYADVYYFGDFEAKDGELDKLKSLCKGCFAKRHGKYDFGSWQELIGKIGQSKIQEYDELILTNDSCYGPISDLGATFTEMGGRECDFWGLSSAYLNHIHIQSYFVVIKNQILQDSLLWDFFKNIEPQNRVQDVCAKYEEQLTYKLAKAGYTFQTLVPYGDRKNHPYVNIEGAIKKWHYPFVKVKFFLGEIRDQGPVKNWREMISDAGKYPIELIESDLIRRGKTIAQIDRIVKNKTVNTPTIFLPPSPFKKTLKKIKRIFVLPLTMLVKDTISSSVEPYFFKTDKLNRKYMDLRRKYDALQEEVSKGQYGQRVYELCQVGQDAYSPQIHQETDALRTLRYDHELPLAQDSDTLVIGCLTEHNLFDFNLDDQNVVYMNSIWSESIGVKGVWCDNLNNFHFEKDGKKVRFNLVIVQPFLEGTAMEAIRGFINNIKQQIIYETVLIMLVPEKEVSKYEKELQNQGFERVFGDEGLSVGMNPYRIYYDKIGSIKGFKTLVYKLK